MVCLLEAKQANVCSTSLFNSCILRIPSRRCTGRGAGGLEQLASRAVAIAFSLQLEYQVLSLFFCQSTLIELIACLRILAGFLFVSFYRGTFHALEFHIVWA